MECREYSASNRSWLLAKIKASEERPKKEDSNTLASFFPHPLEDQCSLILMI